MTKHPFENINMIIRFRPGIMTFFIKRTEDIITVKI